ncbi:YggT family protein [Saccharibacter sp. 17.LH.SD]|uniref:YggT family protein n=1 Tax=Saccharibacter sp. 17.LH.SD TaxID=2689393 RepID=UPI00136FC473|nr:YggT family protein [Saccharibacter sp. 17.LH.SD]MXV45113.1 YggT family protein [Saccharibacter sp. 17.LH.SD]
MKIITQVLHVYVWIILAYCLISMLVSFGIFDIRNNRFLYSLVNTLSRLVEPALRPIRAILPNMGAMDFSPLILLLIIDYVVPFILNEIFRLIYASSAF